MTDDHVSLLRPELVQRWARRQQELARAERSMAKKKQQTAEDKEDKAKEKKDLGVALNVNVFMPFLCSADDSEVVHDEERVCRASDWLWGCILPA